MVLIISFRWRSHEQSVIICVCIPLAEQRATTNWRKFEAILIDLCYSDRKIGWMNSKWKATAFEYSDDEAVTVIMWLLHELSNMSHKKSQPFTVNSKCLPKLSLLRLFNGILTHLMGLFSSLPVSQMTSITDVIWARFLCASIKLVFNRITQLVFKTLHLYSFF